MKKTSFLGRVSRAWKASIGELRGQSVTFGTGLGALRNFFNFLYGGEEQDSGQVVSASTGTRVNTIFNCLNILAQDIAKLPKQVRRDSDNGKELVKDDLHYILNFRPNQWETAWHFWYGMIFVGEGWGNSYAYIQRDRFGNVKELRRLKTECVVPQIIEGELVYVVDNQYILYSYEVFHYRSLIASDSPIGEQKILYNAKTVGLKIKQQKYQVKSTGSKPPGVIFGEFSEKQLEDNRQRWNKVVSGDDVGGTPFMSGDFKYQPLMLAPDVVQIVEQNKLTDEYLAAIWRVQPAKLGIHQQSNYNVVEQQNIIHVQDTLLPIITNLEQEIDNKLFPASNEKAKTPMYVKFNVKGLLRGDTKTQTEFYKLLIFYGIASADEIREWEDMPPQEGGLGKKVYIQLSMTEKGSAPVDSKQQDQRMQDMLVEFAKKHKINRYANIEQ